VGVILAGISIRDRLLADRRALLDLGTRNRLVHIPLRTKNIRAIVPFTAGSATDIIPRTVFNQLSIDLGQPILQDEVVDVRRGEEPARIHQGGQAEIREERPRRPAARVHSPEGPDER